MAISRALKAILAESYDLNISAIVEENPNWSNRMVNDYFSKQSNINALAELSDTDADQIIINKENIVILQQQMVDITVAVTENAAAIVVVQDNLGTHEASDSAHGVAGDNVGTLDYCTPILGGVVLLAVNVADAAVLATDITLPDLLTAPVAYNSVYATQQSAMANECKAKINDIITDIENIKTQLNAVLASTQAAKQMAV